MPPPLLIPQKTKQGGAYHPSPAQAKAALSAVHPKPPETPRAKPGAGSAAVPAASAPPKATAE
eukprot:14894419-Alexandrium_andersonii.AAC.1